MKPLYEQSDCPRIETIELEKIKVGLKQIVSRELLGATVDIYAEGYLTSNIIIEIRGFVWAEKKSLQHKEIKYPADWKQSLKERWFPKWLLHKFPVKYTEIVWDVKTLYPTIKHTGFDARLAIMEDIKWEAL